MTILSAMDITKYIVSQYPQIKDLTNLKIQKLLYYAQGFYLAFTGEKLFSETIEAWTHGPVVKEVYQEIKKNHESYDILNFEPPTNLFSWNLNKKIFLDRLIEIRGTYTALELREKTHQELPWVKFYKENSYDNDISLDCLEEYFSSQLEEFGSQWMFKDLDQTISLLDSEEDNPFGYSDELLELAKRKNSEDLETNITDEEKEKMVKEMAIQLSKFTD